jgi:hypothetical protein
MAGWGKAFEHVWRYLFQKEGWVEYTLLPNLQRFVDSVAYPITEVRVGLRAIGMGLDLDPPGRCEVYPYDSPDGNLGTHNIDSPDQLMILWGLISIWFAAVADVCGLYDTWEELETRIPRVDPDSLSEARYKLVPKKPRGGEFFICKFDNDDTPYYVFAQDWEKAAERAEKEMPLLGQLASFQVETLRADDCQLLPVLISLRPPKHNDDSSAE